MIDYYKLAGEYKKEFLKNPEGFLIQIGKFQSIRGILVEVYRQLVKDGECSKIEDLPEKEKRELWQEARRISDVQEQNYLIEVVKALHGFGQYLQI